MHACMHAFMINVHYNDYWCKQRVVNSENLGPDDAGETPPGWPPSSKVRRSANLVNASSQLTTMVSFLVT